jgi:hypothetical protein
VVPEGGDEPGGPVILSISSVPEASPFAGGALFSLSAGFSEGSGFEGEVPGPDFSVSPEGEALLASALGSGLADGSGSEAALDPRSTGALACCSDAALLSESGSGTSPPPQPAHDKHAPAITRRPNHALFGLMVAILNFWSGCRSAIRRIYSHPE